MPLTSPATREVIHAADFRSAGSDAAQIQAAINEADALTGLGGATVLLEPRKYDLTATPTIRKQSTSLLGQGWGNGSDVSAPGRGTVLAWTVGAGKHPMLQVNDSRGVLIDNIRFQGVSASATADIPTAAIRFNWMTGETTGTNSRLIVSRCYIGPWSYTADAVTDHTVEVGVLFDGDNGNNDEWSIRDTYIRGCSVAGVKVPNSQSVWNEIRQSLIAYCPVGVQTDADLAAYNIQFNRNDVDWKVGLSTACTAWVYGYHTEHAVKYLDLGPASRFVVLGGDLQMQTELGATMMEAADTNNAHINLRSVNFAGAASTSKIRATSMVGWIGANKNFSLVMEDCSGFDYANQLAVEPTQSGFTANVRIRSMRDNVDFSTRVAYPGSLVVPSWPDNQPVRPNPLLVTGGGEFTWDRRLIANSVAGTSGTLYLVYFTAQRTETINTLTAYSGTTAAGATPTLVRYAALSEASNGDLTLRAATTSDTSIFAVANTDYPKALSAAWTKNEGQRYALGVLFISGTTMPTWYGLTLPGASLADQILGVTPRWSGQVAGLTDLPSIGGVITAASIANTRRQPFMRMSP